MSLVNNSLCKMSPGGLQLVTNLVGKAHQEFDIVYGVDFFANHLPHALYTICSLGASLERILEYYDHYVQRLESLRSPEYEIKVSNWKEYIGTQKAYPEFCQFFDKEVTRNGLAGTFSTYFPQLMGFSLGEALHPLIHIGFGMEFSDPSALTEGLAYACTYPLYGSSSIIRDIDMDTSNSEIHYASVLELLNETRIFDFPPLAQDIGTFHDKTEYLLQKYAEKFQSMLRRWDLSCTDSFTENLNELTEASILAVFATYQDKVDFFLVHGITANHATRMVFPHLDQDEQKKLLRSNLLALLTTYVIQRMPEVNIDHVLKYVPKNEEKNEEITWENIISSAVEREEEHVSKVVRSLIYFMEHVPVGKKSSLFSNEFCKRCAFKCVDLLDDINDYVF